MSDNGETWDGGLRIGVLMEKAGLTPTHVAARCNVTEATARGWVKGQRVPSCDLLVPIARAVAEDGDEVGALLFILGVESAEAA